ncbi:MAG: ATP-binding cassette domain-containing protein [Clostridiales bacterium]|nr:ATP-binding cassette domain-containing protein [Clostridiales bacterium]
MDYLLKTDCLTKQYGRQKAVDNVSLHIRQGDIYGFIGRNGAGKTTFLRMVSGLAAPTSGSYSLYGYTGAAAGQVLHRVGNLIEAPGLYPQMSAYENMKVKCLCAGIRRPGYIESLLELVKLDGAGKKKVRHFSLGMKQRLGIAIALVGDPDLLVLDEPINGLDPQGIAEVRDIVQNLNRERNITILISSHILTELSKIATHYGIIHEGRLIRELSREQLLELSQDRIEIRLDQPQQACTVLEGMGFTQYRVVDKNTIQVLERLDESGSITMELSRAGIPVNSIGVTQEDLETYFLNLTGGAHHV